MSAPLATQAQRQILNDNRLARRKVFRVEVYPDRIKVYRDDGSLFEVSHLQVLDLAARVTL